MVHTLLIRCVHFYFFKVNLNQKIFKSKKFISKNSNYNPKFVIEKSNKEGRSICFILLKV